MRFVKGKLVSAMMLALLLTGILALAFNVRPAEASGTIYIRADGSIDPPDAPLSTFDNVTYTLTGNITSDAYGIVVERSNIKIDGAGHTLQGKGGGFGFRLDGSYAAVNNVTIKRTNIKEFSGGISLLRSSNNSITGNNITNNNYDGGIRAELSNNNILCENNVTNNSGYGIRLESLSSNSSITGNNIVGNNWDGVYLSGSLNNTIIGNNIANNQRGIVLSSSNNNTITTNNVTNSAEIGICLYSSSYNVLRGNRMTGNKYNFEVMGYDLSNFNQDVDVSNTADGKPIYYWVNKQNVRVPADAGYVALVDCANIRAENLDTKNNCEGVLLAHTEDSVIEENNMTSNQYGILLCFSSKNNTIVRNNIRNNNYGIRLSNSSQNTVSENNVTNTKYNGVYLSDSSDNTLIGNNITGNSGSGILFYPSSNNTVSQNNIINNVLYGISLVGSCSNNTLSENNISYNGYFGIDLSESSNNTASENNITNNFGGILLESSSNNSIYHNSFVDNSWHPQALSYDSNNVWDDGYPSGGNYWSDYTGVDLNRGYYQNVSGSDGIGDTPYVIDTGNQDRYPLMSSVDTDGDGLYDQWEKYGIDVNGDGTMDLDLPAMGANWEYKDLFLEIDYMGSNGTHDHKPDQNAINDVVTAFRNAPVNNPNGTNGIALHILVDEEIPHQNVINVVLPPGPPPQAWPDFDAIKNNRFGNLAQRNDPNILAAKRMAYRYCLFIHQWAWWNGAAWVPTDSSGIAELPGNDFIVSLGEWFDQQGMATRDEQAGTLMHEFGHTLGLRHGGGDNINGKPNYLSIMSYSRQFSDFIPNRPLDYSRAKLPTLDEPNLDETVGIQGPLGGQTIHGPLFFNATSGRWQAYSAPSQGAIDWNRDRIIETGVAVNINDFRPVFRGPQDDTLGMLEGYDDWSNIQYNFRSTAEFADGVHVSVADQEITWEIVEQMRNTTVVGFHDIATLEIALSKTIVGQGYSLDVNVTVANQGHYTEIFNVTVYGNTTEIETQEITLASGESASVVIAWDTAGSAIGNYAMTVCATPVPDETDTADNNMTGGWILVTIPGDVDGDVVGGKYDVFLYDAVRLLACYGAKDGDPNFDPNCDIDNCGKVSLFDAVILLSRYGQKYP
jgi:parallel beta-helix repeat protein